MKKQHLPIECAENGRKAGRQVLLKLLIMIVCAATVFGLFGGCGGSGENNPTDAPTPAQTIRLMLIYYVLQEQKKMIFWFYHLYLFVF